MRDQGIFKRRQAKRHRADTNRREASAKTSFTVHLDGGGDSGERKVVRADAGFEKMGMGMLREARKADLSEHFTWLDRGNQRAEKIIGGPNSPAAIRSFKYNIGVQGDCHARQFGNGVGMRQRAANRTAVSRRRVTVQRQRLSGQWTMLADKRRTFAVRLTNHCADHELFVLNLYIRKVAADVEVDQGRRGGDAEVHQRHKTLAAGKNPRVFATLPENVNSFRRRAGTEILEWPWLHSGASSSVLNGQITVRNLDQVRQEGHYLRENHHQCHAEEEKANEGPNRVEDLPEGHLWHHALERK